MIDKYLKNMLNEDLTSLDSEELEHHLVKLYELDELKEGIREELTLRLNDGYESDKFEIVQRKKVEFVDPIEAEEVLFDKFGEKIYTKKIKTMSKIKDMVKESGVAVRETLSDPFIKRIPTSEKALAKRKEIEKGE